MKTTLFKLIFLVLCIHLAQQINRIHIHHRNSKLKHHKRSKTNPNTLHIDMFSKLRFRKGNRIETQGSCQFKDKVCECKFTLGKEFANMVVQNAYIPEKNIDLIEKVKLEKEADDSPMSDEAGLLTIKYSMDNDDDKTCDKFEKASIR